jgi:UDP-N-acetylmuramoyl-L-alanyl-D-glutamate--2,6-diaminopimelate ligase
VTPAGARPGGRAWRLGELLEGLAAIDVSEDRDIGGLALDSRCVSPGDLFFACAGGHVHGIRHADQAIAAGAAAVVYEPFDGAPPRRHVTGTPLIAVDGLARRMGEIAARFHGHPSRDLTVIGITGTNGKTSCCHYVAQTLGTRQEPCGVIGTLGYGLYGALRPASHTTPDALTIQAELARLRDAGARCTAMEVSSHALAQGRVEGVSFAAAVFTNLSHDHLDYHGDLARYGAAKARLFGFPGLRFAVINRGDAFGRELIGAVRPPVRCIEYGLDGGGPAAGRDSLWLWGDIVRLAPSGMEVHVRSSWGEARVSAPLLGRFNAENLLATLAVLLALGVPLEEAARRVEGLRAVPGRMERFGGKGGAPLVIVDYAHTPDALEQVLTTLAAHPHARLWCVFGCGGERDRAKRPLMGAIAARHADRVVLTSDNPRSESPRAIIDDIRSGMPAEAAIEVIADRAAAIRRAIEGAASGDVVLIAGKGHEDYQQIGDQRRPFSDRLEVRSVLGEAA